MENDIYSGMAALAICESLLLALNDSQVLSESDIIGVLKDASTTHRSANGPGTDAAMHQAVADLIDRIIDGGNSVRRP